MMASASSLDDSPRQVVIRLGDTAPLRWALDETDQGFERSDLVLVERDDGARVVARVVSNHVPADASMEPVGRIIGRYVVNPLSSTRVRDIVSGGTTIAPDADGHDWGTLGLPQGMDTAVSEEEQAGPSDWEIALASAGYQETQSSKRHSLVPGDRVIFDDKPAMINAIDRRRNAVELRLDEGHTTVEVTMDRLVQEEEST